jgi:hypothetical protein
VKEYDGLELLVRFYDNHGALKQVSERTGVPVKILEKWMSGGSLPRENRDMLENCVDKEWTGKVMVEVGESIEQKQ